MTKKNEAMHLIAKLDVKATQNPFDKEIRETRGFLKSLINDYILVSRGRLEEFIKTKANVVSLPKFNEFNTKNQTGFEIVNTLSIHSKYLMPNKPELDELNMVKSELTKQIILELEREVSPNEKETIDLLNNNNSSTTK